MSIVSNKSNKLHPHSLIADMDMDMDIGGGGGCLACKGHFTHEPRAMTMKL